MHLALPFFSGRLTSAFARGDIVGDKRCYQDASSIWDQLNDGKTEHTLSLPPLDNSSFQERVMYRVRWNKNGSLSAEYHHAGIEKQWSKILDFFSNALGVSSGNSASELAQLNKSLNSEVAQRLRVMYDPQKTYLKSWNFYHQNLFQEYSWEGLIQISEEALSSLLKGELPDSPLQLSRIACALLSGVGKSLFPPDVDKKGLAQAIFSKLNSLRLHVGKELIDAQWAFEILKKNTSIKELHLNLHHISPDVLKALTALLRDNTTITSLSITGGTNTDPTFQELVKALKNNTTIVDLRLSDWENLNEESSQLLVDYVHENKKLTKLELRRTSPSGAKAKDFAATIQNSATLTQLTLDCVGGSPLALTFLEAVAANKVLHEFCYRGPLNLDCVNALSEIIKHTELKKLTLTNTDDVLNCDHTKLLLAVIEKNQSLVVVALDRFKLDGLGNQVAAVIANNKHLRALGLKHGELGNAGARLIGDALKGQSTLEELSLGGNNIYLMDIDSLVEGLGGNARLKVLDLSDENTHQTRLRVDALSSFVRALSKNQTLQTLGIDLVNSPVMEDWLARNGQFNQLSEWMTSPTQSKGNMPKSNRYLQTMIEMACCLKETGFPAELLWKIMEAILAREKAMEFFRT